MTQHDLPADVAGQREAVVSGAVSALDLTEAALARIEALDPVLNAFTVVLAEEARTEAADRDAARSRGEPPGPLHGVPVVIKDENDVRGTVTTFGGRANVHPVGEDGHVTRRLREAGAVVVGKTTLPEFGQYPFTESDRFGVTRNPWDPSRTPGGSSGGTAAAVAAGIVAAGIGGDGGGSIRLPAACCGLFGLKPSRGRVSTAPAPHLWLALGVLGPLTRTVRDSALVLDVIRGAQPGDRWSAPPPDASFLEAAEHRSPRSARRLRIGWSAASPVPGVRPDSLHVTALEEVAALLDRRGHHVEEVRPRYPDVTAAFLPQVMAGVREEAEQMDRPELLERRTRTALRLGAWATPRVVDWALRKGEAYADLVDRRVLGDLDLLLTPMLAARPQPLPVVVGSSYPVAMLRSLPMVAYAQLWNVTGHPAASVPAGTGPDGLPLAVQLVGRRGEETTILAASAELEHERPWAHRWPPLAVEGRGGAAGG